MRERKRERGPRPNIWGEYIVLIHRGFSWRCYEKRKRERKRNVQKKRKKERKDGSAGAVHTEKERKREGRGIVAVR